MNDLPRPAAFESLESRDLVALFNWLSAVFATPPDRASIASYRHGPAAAWLESVASLPGCAEAVERMRCALEADAEDALVAAQVGSAYGILFEGIGGPRTVSPYESVHADGGRLFGAPAAAMEAILAAHDLSVAASAHEAPDHIAVELAAAARLLAEGEPDADAVIARLRGWVPTFAADCAAADANGFWAGAAAVVIAIVGLATRQPANAEIPNATKH
jgi:TorA-specific chaperone